MKIGAVTAALACAGGGLVIDHATSASGAASTPSITLDHYLCTGSFHHGGCDPTTVALPDGTSFGINNPGDTLSCAVARRGPRGLTTNETNELSPGGTTAVPLLAGEFRATCSLLPAVQSPAAVRAHVTVVPIESFTCSSVHYPSRNAVRFAPPFPVTVNGQSARVGDPRLLCTPSIPQATIAGATDLVCFEARFVSNRRRFFESGFGLCVPSTDPVTPPGSSTTTTARATTTTAPPTTTTAPPTTTTAPATTTTTRPATTTTTAPPTTMTAPPTTSTQPCAGVLIGGVCIINA